MSSAILYVAIVAIWACVLIPRWLHRETAGTETESTDHSSERIVPSPLRAPSSSSSPEVEASRGDAPLGRPRAPLPQTETRRRMLAARRRMLLMLLALQAAAVSLTVLHLAALWVLLPPTIMLVGYLLLLREAAQADAEHAERHASRSRAQAAAKPRPRAAAANAATPPPAAPPVAPPAGAPSSAFVAAFGPAAATPTAPAAPSAPAAQTPIPEPAPEDYSDLGNGRDYAPGLAGKYTTSNSDVIDFTQYYKRAVGD